MIRRMPGICYKKERTALEGRECVIYYAETAYWIGQDLANMGGCDVAGSEAPEDASSEWMTNVPYF